MVTAHTAKNLLKTFREARERKSLLQRVYEYRRYVPVESETPELRLTTAENGRDLLNVLKLRHEVFISEWQGRRAFHGLDADLYDFKADHLMIVDKGADQVVGTYRLISSHFTHHFYSSSEFFLNDFLRLPAVRLEMGRACILPKYRHGRVIDLLWKGISQYVQKTKTEYLFGCTSLKTMDPKTVARLLRTLRDQGSWSDEFAIRPRAGYAFGDFEFESVAALELSERRGLIPPLLRSYLHAGAKVFGHPALDGDFLCTDILTVLDWKSLNARFQSRFLSES